MAQAVKHPKGNVQRMAEPFVVAGSTVVDVGANAGNFCGWALERAGAGGLGLVIEPDPRCHDTLRVVVARVPAIAAFYFGAVGVWTQPGEATLYQSSETAFSTLLNTGLPKQAIGPFTQTLVPVTSLDALIDNATLVKIDAQGLDHQVLQGAKKLLQRCNAWIVECWPAGLKAAQTTPHALWQELVNAGLTVCFADGVVVTEENLAEWEGSDQIFVNWLATR